MSAATDQDGPLVVTLGEIMLRLKSPGHERLFQSACSRPRSPGAKPTWPYPWPTTACAARYRDGLPRTRSATAPSARCAAWVSRPTTSSVALGAWGSTSSRPGPRSAPRRGLRPGWRCHRDRTARRVRLGHHLRRRGLVPHLGHHAGALGERGGINRSQPASGESGRSHDIDRPQLSGQAVALRQDRARGHARPHGSMWTWPSATRRTPSSRWASMPPRT